jgi:thiamine transporter ThiT
MAMLVSLAIVLDLPGLKIRIGASGGSIGFTMLPLFVLVLRQGPIKGFIGAGIVYGFVTCILDGWGLVYYPFDYLLGYGSMALLGIFHPFILSMKIERFNIRGLIFLIIGVLVSISGRLIASTLSGMIYYELNFIDSLLYNIAYILPSAGIVLGLLIALYHPIIRMNRAIAHRNG